MSQKSGVNDSFQLVGGEQRGKNQKYEAPILYNVNENVQINESATNVLPFCLLFCKWLQFSCPQTPSAAPRLHAKPHERNGELRKEGIIVAASVRLA